MDRMCRISAELLVVPPLQRAGGVPTEELVLILNILSILVNQQICQE
jgi:hypothetical protein